LVSQTDCDRPPEIEQSDSFGYPFSINEIAAAARRIAARDMSHPQPMAHALPLPLIDGEPELP